MKYYRACAAIIKGEYIIMVLHQHEDGRSYWTLPGGGVKYNEDPKDTVVREVNEELNITVEVIKYLFKEESYNFDSHIISLCFLVKPVGKNKIRLGHDPELPLEKQILKQYRWFNMSDIKHDKQISKVLKEIL